MTTSVTFGEFPPKYVKNNKKNKYRFRSSRFQRQIELVMSRIHKRCNEYFRKSEKTARKSGSIRVSVKL
jgi:hypothetical protein